MTKFKRITAALLILIMTVSLCACSPGNPLAGKWNYNLKFSDIVDSYVKNSIQSADESQKAMYEELYKAFDDCDVMLTMEFNNDKSFKFAVDDESAKSAIEKIKENMKTAIPNAFKAMGMSDEVFEKYLKSQNKTVEDLVNQFTEEFSVDQLTNGVGASGNYELEDNKLFLFTGDKRVDANYCEVEIKGNELSITKVNGTVEGFKSVENILPMKFTKA